MTECVQRHDVAAEDLDAGAALLAKIEADSKAAIRQGWVFMAWVVGPMVALTVALAVIAAIN